MALSGNRLKTAAQSSIYDKLKALQTPKIPIGANAQQRADVDQMWQDMATAMAESMPDIISEFVSNAILSTSVSVISVSGVTAGPAASGPGTGTGTGTVS